MNFSQTLLTQMKATYGGASDYKVAQILEVSKQNVSDIKRGKTQFCDETLVKIAQYLDLDPAETVAQKHIETEKSHIMRQFWEGILENAHLATIRASRGIQADQVA